MNPNNECKCCDKCWHINMAHPTSRDYCADIECECHTPNPTEEKFLQEAVEANFIGSQARFLYKIIKELNPTTVSEDWRKEFENEYCSPMGDLTRQETLEIISFIEEVEQKAYERGVDDCARGLHNGRIVLLNNEDIEDEPFLKRRK